MSALLWEKYWRANVRRRKVPVKVRQPIVAAAVFQPELHKRKDSRLIRKCRLKGGCRQDCLPHDLATLTSWRYGNKGPRYRLSNVRNLLTHYSDRRPHPQHELILRARLPEFVFLRLRHEFFHP